MTNDFRDMMLLLLILAVGWLLMKQKQVALPALSQALPARQVPLLPQVNILNALAQSQQQTQKTTRILTERITVSSSGTPVQLPKGKSLGDVRFSSPSTNAGAVYLSESYQDSVAGRHRFSLQSGKDMSLPVKELSGLWVDSDNDSDLVEVFAQIESN